MIKNEFFDVESIKEDSILVCAIGHEERSYYLYDQLGCKIKDSNKLVFYYDDYEMTQKSNEKLDEIKNNPEITTRMYEYHDAEKAIACILQFIDNKISCENQVIHVDYTSMPRSWFCRLAIEFKKKTLVSKFWYTEGKYPDDYKLYPGAGIEDFVRFSGTPTLRVDKRLHILGLSYDMLRTQAMISMLDPEAYVACFASNSNNITIKNNLRRINEQIIMQSLMSVSLQVEDFESMINKLSEFVLDYISIGDIVLVPDGPKPLIMAMSLIPEVVRIQGVTCLHVTRNKKFFKPIDVKPIDSIIGFSFS